jgi:hypothetical protein
MEVIPELKNTKSLSMEQQKEKEGEAILKALQPGDVVVLLDEHGKEFRSIVGKLSALLQSIPQGVLGGIMLLLFGTIASVGVQNLMQNKVDMNETRNVIIISVMLTMGLGGAVLSSGSFAISGIGLSAVIGVVLNLVLPKTKKKEA